MTQPNRQEYTVEEYLWEEQRSSYKREYFKGQVYAMAGGSVEHSTIAVNHLFIQKEIELSLADLYEGVNFEEE